MAKKKYVRDYEISETIDEKGRVRSVPIYVGSYFCFCDAAAAKKSGRLLAPAAALGWLAYIVALWLPSGAGKLMYVILPFVFAAVPLWYVSSAVAELLRAGDKLKRSEAEKVAESPSASVFGIILTAVALIAEGITAIAAPEKLNAADISFAAGAVILCAAFALSFSPPSGGGDEAYSDPVINRRA